MVAAPAAITAQLVDVRNVAAHKSVRLELHVPAEQAGLVMAAFGWPTMADPVPVALARLLDVAQVELEQPKPRTPFSDLPYAQQAAMRCNEEGFQSFARDRAPAVWASHIKRGSVPNLIAADLVRDWCRVNSRADITKGHQSGDCWASIEADFFAWSRGMR